MIIRCDPFVLFPLYVAVTIGLIVDNNLFNIDDCLVGASVITTFDAVVVVSIEYVVGVVVVDSIVVVDFIIVGVVNINSVVLLLVLLTDIGTFGITAFDVTSSLWHTFKINTKQ